MVWKCREQKVVSKFLERIPHFSSVEIFAEDGRAGSMYVPLSLVFLVEIKLDQMYPITP